MKVVPPEPFTFEGGERAVLLLHGFTGTTADVRMLGRFLQKRGYTCHAPIYKGHGVPPEELMKTTPSDWWYDVEKGLEKLKNDGYEEIAVAGLSLGGLMTLKAAYTFNVKGIVPMCAPMTTSKNKERLYQGVLQYAKEYKQLEKKSDEDIDKEMEAFKGTTSDTLTSINEFIEEVRESLDMIYAPAYIAQAKKDEMVELKSAEIIRDEISSDEKKLQWYEESPHVITLGKEKQELHENIYQFLEKLAWGKDN
ncbi:alpha/beta hydrolase [Alteribacillus sp. HJP-4]|uniref:alpha/beta hydrolase n=1 Tax=Alteribacillus sp. HJP-4 TaxID=2775394 RepID=UPI0035CD34E7